MTLATLTNRIDEIVEAYPNVDLASEPRGVVEEMANRWLITQIKARERTVVRVVERRSYNADRVAVATKNAVNSLARDVAQRIEDARGIVVAGAKLAAWGKVLDEEFALSNGRRVKWRDATLADHEERANALEILAASELDTAGLHRRAIGDIRAAHVNTLGELDDEMAEE